MRLLFVTGTRAEWGKIAPLVAAVRGEHDVHVAVTGQHLLAEYGTTACEVETVFAAEPWRVWRVPNGVGGRLGIVLSDTVRLISHLLDALAPDLVVVHGDRSEALGAACASVLHGIRLAHVEGGEVSGGMDEMMRHAITKLAHMHFVSSSDAAAAVRQLGERADSIHAIGSPEVDVMLGPLPALSAVRDYYHIPWGDWGIVALHPDSADPDGAGDLAHAVCGALADVGRVSGWVALVPNADPGHDVMLAVLREHESSRFRLIPSMRARYWYRALLEARVIVGNSSTIVREAPVYGTPAVLVGSRQEGRSDVVSVAPERGAIARAVIAALDSPVERQHFLTFGDGHASERFAAVLARGLGSVRFQKRLVRTP